jgi:hypothetical protein
MKSALLGALLVLTGCGGATESDGETGGASGNSGSGGTTPAGGAGGVAGVGGNGTGGASGAGGGAGGGSGGGAAGSPTCSLEMVASGELPGAESPGSRFAGPGLAVTDSGFALAYAETTTEMQSLRFVRIDGSGEATVTGNAGASSCPSFEQSPGLGASFTGSQGLAIGALPLCNDGTGAGALFSSFTQAANVGTWAAPKSPNFSGLFLSAQPVAPTPLEGEHYFAYVAESGGEKSVQLAIVQGVSFKPAIAIEFLFPSAPADFVNIAASPALLAIAANVPSVGGLVFELRDHASTPLGTGILPSAPWAALAAWDLRVAVVAPSPSGLALTVVEAKPGGPIDLGVISGDVPQSAAVARLETGLVLALANPGEIQVLKTASELNPSMVASTALDVDGFSGSRVALAAGHGRVLVAWLEPTKAPSQSSGGWALLDCAQ